MEVRLLMTNFAHDHPMHLTFLEGHSIFWRTVFYCGDVSTIGNNALQQRFLKGEKCKKMELARKGSDDDSRYQIETLEQLS